MTVEHTPEFGEPVEQVPAVRQTVRHTYWVQVAEYARAHHGQWIPLLNTPHSYQRLRNIDKAMRGRKPSELGEIPQAMNQPGMRVRYVNKVFYFRYDKPEGEE